MNKEQISFADSTKLRYNGKTLWADRQRMPYCSYGQKEFMAVSPQQLQQILKVGRTCIETAIAEAHKKQILQNANQNQAVPSPAIWALKIGSDNQTRGDVMSRVLSEKGFENHGLHDDKDDILDRFHDYWNVIEDAGFDVQAREIVFSGCARMNGGSYLMINQKNKSTNGF